MTVVKPQTLEAYGETLVTLDGVTKPLKEWVAERGLTLQLVRDRRKRNSWAESLQPGNLRSKTLRKVWHGQKPK